MGVATSKYKWSHLNSMLRTIPEAEGGKNKTAFLFRQSLDADPCRFIGKNLVNLATECAQRLNLGLYATGYGNCTHCSKPKMYSWNGKNYTPTEYSSFEELSSTIDKKSSQDNLNYIYVLNIDEDFNIHDVSGVYYREGNTLYKKPGCKPVSPQSNSFAMSSSSKDWIAIIILIILVLLIFFIIFKN
jgi:hypothetical protein